MSIAVVGAGVVGLSCALELSLRGAEVQLYERSQTLGDEACSWFAGGMLAPWCERESAEELVLVQGQQALKWWQTHTDLVQHAGSLVVANGRDRQELKRFAARTQDHETLNAEQVAALEPDLAGRFMQGLFFPQEAHLDPRQALQQLHQKLCDRGVLCHFGQAVEPEALEADCVLDCRGFSARKALPALRGVKGEMLMLHCPDVQLTRTVRWLHPRIPLYIVPRGEGIYMLGATMVESADRGHISTRALLEMLGAAYALHPAFADAQVLETGVDVRPAFADNLPRIQRQGRILRVNGFYRHGFLLSPVMAQRAAACALDPTLNTEVV